ncbi:MAG: T9SS type A sorting domain-containing protein [Bacteroidetes bacterium]|nr:T9SS type A sorting domain-containing protein [Bacteroidota bacterium]
MLKTIPLFVFIFLCTTFFAQPYIIKKFNWKDAGYKGTKPTYTQTVNIMNFGGNNTNSASNNTAVNNAINALNGKGGVVFFPKGVYNFTTTVSVNRDSITFKGAGSDSTHLRFGMNGTLNNCFNVWGSQINSDTSSFVSAGVRDSNWVNVFNPSAFMSGDWVHLITTDNTYMNDSWAYGSLGQIMQVKSINGNKITFESPFRFYYKLSLQPRIRRLNKRTAIGFECMKVQRLDATTGQTSLISFNNAVQCWIHGIESDSTNFTHVELNRSSNIEITNSWFHHAFAYGGSGQGYGIAFQFSSGECKVENNIFQHLRHSMLFQAGANGNVCGYNYSFDPFWSQFPFPANSSGDIVFHGNFPFANLCEGNINQNTVIDNSHSINGPFNTIFRNRSELYGVVMNNNPASDTVQFLGLEITNTSSPYGQFVLNGNGHLQYGNRIQGNLTPAGSNSLSEISLYYINSQKPICFNPGNNNWPILGVPNVYNTGSNSARDRYLQGKMASCVCTATFTTTGEEKFVKEESEPTIYPNPAGETVSFRHFNSITEINIYAMDGKLLLNKQGRNIQTIEINSIFRGIYYLTVKDRKGLKTYKLIKE